MGGQVVGLLHEKDVGWLDDDAAVALLHQLPHRGDEVLDVEDLDGDALVEPFCGFGLSLPPDRADDVGGEGDFDRNAGKRLLDLFLKKTSCRGTVALGCGSFFPAPPFHRETGPAGSFAKPKQKPFKPIYGMKGCTRFT
jgi:hypothetical protein